MADHVEMVGWDQLARAAARLAPACRRAALTAGADAARSLAATTRARVPRRSGRLASSIGTRPEPDGTAVVYGAGLPYAGWIEYGGTRGRPYVADGRYLGAGTDAAARRYERDAYANTEPELRKLPWP